MKEKNKHFMIRKALSVLKKAGVVLVEDLILWLQRLVQIIRIPVWLPCPDLQQMGMGGGTSPSQQASMNNTYTSHSGASCPEHFPCYLWRLSVLLVETLVASVKGWASCLCFLLFTFFPHDLHYCRSCPSRVAKRRLSQDSHLSPCLSCQGWGQGRAG